MKVQMRVKMYEYTSIYSQYASTHGLYLFEADNDLHSQHIFNLNEIDTYIQ